MVVTFNEPVNADDTGPSIVSVGSLNGWDIGVVFDRPVDPTSADSTRFRITSAAGDSWINSVIPRPDGRSFLIMLDYSPVPGPFTVEADWIMNFSGVPTESSFGSGTVLNPAAASQDLGTTGDPIYAGTSFVGSGDNFIEVLAGGSGVTALADGTHFVHQTMTGDFEATVQITGLSPTDPNALAGLMVRPSLVTNDQHLGVFATPAAADGGAGTFQTISRAVSNAPATVLASSPQFAYPANWVRLQRAGHSFITSYSANGTDWTPLSTNTPSPAYPSVLQVGLATTARNNAVGLYTRANYAGFTSLRAFSGQLALEGFAGATRAVTFTLTDGATYTNLTTLSGLSFNGGVASYRLTAPISTLRLSAKTAWNLRKVIAVTPTSTTVANFTGGSMLPAGDLDGSNQIDLADYYALAAVWYQSNAAADVDGNGLVNLDDYFLLSAHWNETGEAP